MKIAGLILSFILGLFIFSSDYKMYSDIITFISITTGFQFTSLAIYFTSPLKKTLWDMKNKRYGTELHAISAFFKQSLMFNIISIIVIFIPDKVYKIMFLQKFYDYDISRHIFVMPILYGVLLYFYVLYNNLFKLFTFPTND